MISDEELYKLKEGESKDFPFLRENYKDRFSMIVLKNREFWFSLGFDAVGDLTLSGNCISWSNAFQFDNPNLDFIHKVLNYYEKISKEQLEQIIISLKANQNKLFFCKEDEHSKFSFNTGKLPDRILSWHYYPNSRYDESKETRYTGNLMNDFQELGVENERIS
jgi:hypothetical protein